MQLQTAFRPEFRRKPSTAATVEAERADWQRDGDILLDRKSIIQLSHFSLFAMEESQ